MKLEEVTLNQVLAELQKRESDAVTAHSNAADRVRQLEETVIPAWTELVQLHVLVGALTASEERKGFVRDYQAETLDTPAGLPEVTIRHYGNAFISNEHIAIYRRMTEIWETIRPEVTRLNAAHVEAHAAQHEQTACKADLGAASRVVATLKAPSNNRQI
jgi:hypothetical protein